MTASGAKAQTPVPEASLADRIHITADRMVTQTDTNVAEFTGNVHAVQRGTKIAADRLRVYYKSGGAKGPSDSRSMESAIERIIAEGNVAIDFQEKRAVCEKAVYDALDGRLVLSGKPARIESDGNYITGDEITLNRSTGEIVVRGKADAQVEAVFRSDQEGSGADSFPESGQNGE